MSKFYNYCVVRKCDMHERKMIVVRKLYCNL